MSVGNKTRGARPPSALSPPPITPPSPSCPPSPHTARSSEILASLIPSTLLPWPGDQRGGGDRKSPENLFLKSGPPTLHPLRRSPSEGFEGFSLAHTPAARGEGARTSAAAPPNSDTERASPDDGVANVKLKPKQRKKLKVGKGTKKRRSREKRAERLLRRQLARQHAVKARERAKAGKARERREKQWVEEIRHREERIRRVDERMERADLSLQRKLGRGATEEEILRELDRRQRLKQQKQQGKLQIQLHDFNFNPSTLDGRSATTTSATTSPSSPPKQLPPTAVIDEEFLEADAFALFSVLMDKTSSFFETAECDEGNTHGLNARMTHIHHYLLKRYDPELYQHLEASGVHPSLFLLRWIRVMFSREFSVAQTMRIWDWIFSANDMDMVNYFCLAMQGYVRFALLDAQGPWVLQLLAEFPIASDKQLGEILKIAQGIHAGHIKSLVIGRHRLFPLFSNPVEPLERFLNEFWLRMDLEPEKYLHLKKRHKGAILKAGKRLFKRQYEQRPHMLHAYLSRVTWS